LNEQQQLVEELKTALDASKLARTAEKAQWEQHIESLQQKVDGQDELIVLREQLSAAVEDTSKLQDKLASSQAALNTAQEQYRVSNESMARERVRADAAESAMTALEERHHVLKDEKLQLSQELETLKAKYTAVNASYEQQQAETQAKSATIEELTASIERVREETRALQEEYDTIIEEASFVKTQLAERTSALHDTEVLLKAANAQLAEVTSNTDLHSEIERLQLALEHEKSAHKQSDTRANETQSKLEDLTADLATVHTQLEDSRRQLRCAEMKVTELQDTVNQSDSIRTDLVCVYWDRSIETDVCRRLD